MNSAFVAWPGLPQGSHGMVRAEYWDSAIHLGQDRNELTGTKNPATHPREVR